MLHPIDAKKHRAYWERHARLYEVALRFLARPLPRMVELAVQACTGATKVLEIAAGTGLLTIPLARVVQHVTATDYAGAMVERLRTKVSDAHLANVDCEIVDVYSLPYTAGSFDAVVASNVLHLLPDIAAALSSVRRVLRPGGLLVCPTFCHGQTNTSAILSDLLRWTGFPIQHHFTTTRLCSALLAHGVAVEQCELLGGIIPVTYVHGRFTS